MAITLLCLATILSMSLGGFADAKTLMLVAIATLAIPFQATDVIDYLFRAQSRVRAIVVARLSAFLGGVAFRVGLLLGGVGVVGFAWAIVLVRFRAGEPLRNVASKTAWY